MSHARTSKPPRRGGRDHADARVDPGAGRGREDGARSGSSPARLGAHYAAGPAVALAGAGAGAGIQTKLTVGRPGDRYEQEADAVADRVVRGRPAGDVSRIPPGGLGPTGQRQAATSDREDDATDPVQRQAVETPEEQPPVEEGQEAKPVQKMAAEEPEEPVQEMAEDEPEEPVQEMAEDEPEQPVQEMAADEPETPVQEMAATEPEEPVQKKAMDLAREEPRAVEGEDVSRPGARMEEQEPEVQRMEPEDEQPVQTRSAPARAGGPPPAAGRRAAVASAVRERGPGRPLEPATRRRLESGLGVDLSDVRLHASPRDREVSRGLGARAFTHGRDIWLGPGESPSDLTLLAHEATHVLQQGGVARRKPRPDTGGEATENLEGADTVAKAAPAGEPTSAPEEPSPPGRAKPAAERSEEPGDGDPAEGEGGSAGGDGAGAPGPPAASGAGPPAAGTGAGSDGEGSAALGAVLRDVRALAREQAGPAASPSRARAESRRRAAEASAAAPSPDREAAARGEGEQVAVMAGQAPGEVDKASFLDLVKKKLREMDVPANPSEMDRFKERGGASGLRADLAGEVTRQKAVAAGGIATATRTEPPAPAARVPGPRPARREPPPARDPRPERVVPAPAPDARVSLDANRDAMETTLSRERLTRERLERANDPRFRAAQQAREEVHEHADTAPARFRDREAAVRAEESGAARALTARGALGMRGGRTAAEGGLLGRQGSQMSEEEAARRRLTSELEAIYTAAKSEVDEKLTWLDGEVDRWFTAREAFARQDFESYVDKEARRLEGPPVLRTLRQVDVDRGPVPGHQRAAGGQEDLRAGPGALLQAPGKGHRPHRDAGGQDPRRLPETDLPRRPGRPRARQGSRRRPRPRRSPGRRRRARPPRRPARHGGGQARRPGRRPGPALPGSPPDDRRPHRGDQGRQPEPLRAGQAQDRGGPPGDRGLPQPADLDSPPGGPGDRGDPRRSDRLSLEPAGRGQAGVPPVQGPDLAAPPEGAPGVAVRHPGLGRDQGPRRAAAPRPWAVSSCRCSASPTSG